MNKSSLRLVAVATLMGAAASEAGITTYSDRSAFNAAIGVGLYVEDFSPNYSFPIDPPILNQFTSLTPSSGAPIVPGQILPGVTYSTQPGSGDFFNIDAGGGYDGGFLDALNDSTPDRLLTVTFDNPAAGFGFDATSLMGDFDVTIHFNDGPDISANYPQGTGLAFYGFLSGSADITSLTVHGDDTTFAFALDNFTYPSGRPVPDGANSLALLGFGLSGIAAARRRFAKSH